MSCYIRYYQILENIRIFNRNVVLGLIERGLNKMIFVSACLVGINCKYNGGNNYNNKIFNLVKQGKAIPICPEQLGGLQTPRNPSEIKIIDGKRYVIDNKGTDVTQNFDKGAKEVLKLAKELKIKKVILKSKSPSCRIW